MTAGPLNILIFAVAKSLIQLSRDLPMSRHVCVWAK